MSSPKLPRIKMLAFWQNRAYIAFDFFIMNISFRLRSLTYGRFLSSGENQ